MMSGWANETPSLRFEADDLASLELMLTPSPRNRFVRRLNICSYLEFLYSAHPQMSKRSRLCSAQGRYPRGDSARPQFATDRLAVRGIVGTGRRNAGWRHVETHHDAFEFGARGRIELHHERIVTRDDVALVRRKFQ